MARRVKEWDVVVVGGASIEYVMLGSGLPGPGQALAGQRFVTAATGRGARQAIVAARLGARAAIVGRIGDDGCGDALLQRLEVEGVGTRHLVSDDADRPTGVALVMTDEEGRRQALTLAGAAQALAVEDVEAARSMIAASFVLVAQLEVPLECAAAAVRLARGAGVRVLLEATPMARIPGELLASVDVLRVDASTASGITGVRVHDPDSARAAAKALLGRRVGTVALDAGAAGYIVMWQGGESRFEAPGVDGVREGTGDAFTGALAVALAEGHTVQEAAPFAYAAARFTVESAGDFPRRNELYRMIAHPRSTREEVGAGRLAPDSRVS